MYFLFLTNILSFDDEIAQFLKFLRKDTEFSEESTVETFTDNIVFFGWDKIAQEYFEANDSPKNKVLLKKILEKKDLYNYSINTSIKRLSGSNPVDKNDDVSGIQENNPSPPIKIIEGTKLEYSSKPYKHSVRSKIPLLKIKESIAFSDAKEVKKREKNKDIQKNKYHICGGRETMNGKSDITHFDSKGSILSDYGAYLRSPRNKEKIPAKKEIPIKSLIMRKYESLLESFISAMGDVLFLIRSEKFENIDIHENLESFFQKFQGDGFHKDKSLKNAKDRVCKFFREVDEMGNYTDNIPWCPSSPNSQ